jgi:hypothetical protein
VYLLQCLHFLITREVPGIITRTDHPTSVVFALDFTLLIPFMIVGAIWLLQRKPWGYILAGIFTIKGLLYTLGLTIAASWAARHGVVGAANEIPIWLGLTVFGTIANRLLMSNFTTLTSHSTELNTIAR